MVIKQPNSNDNQSQTSQPLKDPTILSPSSSDQDKDSINFESSQKDFIKEPSAPKKLIGFSGYSQKPSKKHPSVPNITNTSSYESCKAPSEYHGPTYNVFNTRQMVANNQPQKGHTSEVSNQTLMHLLQRRLPSPINKPLISLSTKEAMNSVTIKLLERQAMPPTMTPTNWRKPQSLPE